MSGTNSANITTVDTPGKLRKYMQDPQVRAAVIASMWDSGDLFYQFRPYGQTKLADFISRVHKDAPSPLPFVGETHRRFGKSYLWLNILVMRCLSRPWQLTKYFAPTEKQCGKIVRSNLPRILRDCPPHLKPHKSGLTWTFRNPELKDGGVIPESVIACYGTNEDPDATRGEASDAIVLDEAGQMKRLEYLIGEVLVHQFIRRKDPLFAMISTPPPSMDHPFITKYIPRAQKAGRYFFMPASANRDCSHEDKAVVLSEVGSKDSVGWRREMECAHITDTSRMVIPEWQKVREKSIRSWSDPRYFLRDICFDSGAKDYTHALFAYWDFCERKLIVKREVWGQYMSSGEIVAMLEEVQEELWPRQTEIRRFADAPLQQLIDFKKDHGLTVYPAEKYDKDTALNRLRTEIQRGGIIIDPSCVQLIYQLDNGVMNEARTKWARSDTLGHLDGIAALNYLSRMTRRDRNPFPDALRDPDTTFQLSVEENKEESSSPVEFGGLLNRVFGKG